MEPKSSIEVNTSRWQTIAPAPPQITPLFLMQPYFQENRVKKIAESSIPISGTSIQLSRKKRSFEDSTGKKSYRIRKNFFKKVRICPKFSYSLDVRKEEMLSSFNLTTCLLTLGATTGQIKSLSPAIWNTLIDIPGTLDALISYANSGLFSWTQFLLFEDSLAIALLIGKNQVDAAFLFGMQQEDLLTIKGDALLAFFLQENEKPLHLSFNHFEEHKELFFSLHPEAQLCALREKEVEKSEVEPFLFKLQKEAENKQFFYKLSALYQSAFFPLFEGVWALFEEPHSLQALKLQFLSCFSSPNESTKWEVIVKNAFLLEALLQQVPSSQWSALSERHEIIHFIHHAETLLKVTSEGSPFILEQLLQIEDKEERAFFITYAKNVQDILKKGISLYHLLQADGQKRKWVISCWVTLEPLVDEHMPLERLFSEEIAVSTCHYLCLYGMRLVDLLNTGLDLEELLAFEDKSHMHIVIKNSQEMAKILYALKLNWQEFCSHPLKSAFIEYACQAVSLKNETIRFIASLSAKNAARALEYGESLSYLLKHEALLQSCGVFDLFEKETPLLFIFLEHPEQTISFLSLNLLPLADLESLPIDKIHALLSDPQSLLGLLRYFSLQELLTGGKKETFLLKEAEKAVKLFSRSSIFPELFLSLPYEDAVFFVDEVDAVLEVERFEILSSQVHLLNRPYFREALKERIKQARIRLFFEKEKKSLLEVMAQQKCQSLVPIPRGQQKLISNSFLHTQELLLLSEATPAYSIENLLDYFKQSPLKMQRLLQKAHGASFLLKEGVSLEGLLNLPLCALVERCVDALRRKKHLSISG